MDSFFKEKEAKVVVVDPSGAARTLLTEFVRGLGFSDVTGVPGVKEAIGMLEVESVNWLITPLMEDQNENGMKVLKLFCDHSSLRDLRVTFLLEEGEYEVLPDAFSKGLLSYHMKPFTKDSLTQDFTAFFERFESYDWNSALMAASYIRDIMMEHFRYEELLSFERKLLDLFPGHVDQMMNLVPPLALLEKEEEALSTLKQIKLIDPDQDEKITELMEKYLEGKSIADIEGDAINFLHIRKVVVVDSDESVCIEVKSCFSKMGVEDVIICHDGEEAIEAVKENEEIDIVIHEWRIPKLTGPLFLQRAQDALPSKALFILLSSLIEEQDLPFVREMGVANTINKPLSSDSFTKDVIWTVQQDQMPTEQSAMERKMRAHLDAKELPAAEEIKSRFVGDHSIRIGAKQIIESEFAFYKGDYEKARDFAVEAVKNAGDSIFILNLLGKTMMHLRQFEVALRCFEKAKTIAPLNIERLCQIAEAQSEMGDKEAAQETMEEAGELDPDSERIKEASAKLALNSSDTDEAKKLMANLKAIENVVAYMNNQAVALAKCDKFDEGLEQYTKTLEAIPPQRADIVAIVKYNIALAYIRAKDLKNAVEPLTTASVVQSVVMERAKALLKKLKWAIEHDKPLVLKKAQPAPAPETPKPEGDADEEKPGNVLSSATNTTVVSLMAAVAGEMAAFKIFTVEEHNPKALKLLAGDVRFNPRDAIEREATGGADKAMKYG